MTKLQNLRPSGGMIVLVLALVLALGGTATAAKLITGAQIRNSSLTGADVRNSSLTGADVKNGSIGPSDLSAAAKAAKGAKGDTGAPGAQGAPGPKGDTGAAGAPGAAGADTGAALIGRINSLPGDDAIRFAYPSGAGTADSDIADREMLSPAVATLASDFSVRLTDFPGAGGDRFFAVRINGVSQLICSITGNFDTTCASEGSVEVPPSSRIAIVASPTGSPQVTDALFSVRLSKG